MKKIAGFILSLFFLLTIVSCSEGSGNNEGALKIIFRIQGNSRTISPDISTSVDRYRVSYIDGPEAFETLYSEETFIKLVLSEGLWSIGIEALDSDDNTLAAGEMTDISVTNGFTSEETITLDTSQDGTGSIDIVVTWPASVNIEATAIEIFFDSVPVVPTSLEAQMLSYLNVSVNSGSNHSVKIYLTDQGSGNSYSIIEAVHIYDNLTTSASYNLSESDFGIQSNSGRNADHEIVHELWDGNISEADVQQAIDSLHIAYWHTSHGSQLTKGMEELSGFADGGNLGGVNYTDNLFIMDGSGIDLREPAWLDLGAENSSYELIWDSTTRAYLDLEENSDINVVIWAWCGSLSGWDNERVQEYYLDLMNQLEADYPEIVFVYMTGHAESSGTNGNTINNNEYIRNYCEENDKWLYDFYDIECYDPAGLYYGDLYVTDGCNYDADGSGVTEEVDSDGDGAYEPTGGDANWAMAWQDDHVEGVDWFDCVSTHTQPLNGNMKAYAAWWLLVQIGDALQ